MLLFNSDFVQIIAAIFSTGWRIFVSFRIPGTNMNVAEFVFGCMMVLFVVRVVPRILGFSAWWDAHSDRDE